MLFLHIIALFVGHYSGCLSCGDERPHTLEEQIATASVVLHGRIQFHYAQPNIHPDSYVAQMDVRCILKGGPLPRVINITDAGYIPPGCLNTQLILGQKYIVTLERIGQRLRPLDQEINSTKEVLAEIASMCGLDMQLPNGVTPVTAVEKCPEPSNETRCTQQVTTATYSDKAQNASSDSTEILQLNRSSSFQTDIDCLSRLAFIANIVLGVGYLY